MEGNCKLCPILFLEARFYWVWFRTNLSVAELGLWVEKGEEL